MKKTLIPLSLIGILFTGCVNSVVKPTTPVQFITPSKFSMIKKGSNIYIQELHNFKYNSKSLHKGLVKYFKKDKIFNIVNNIKKADVIISLNTFYSYRGDTNSDGKYNIRYDVERVVYRDKKGRETGGYDKLVSSNYMASTATLVSTVSIYNKKDLAPLIYFNISQTDTSKAKSKKGYKSNKKFNSEFTSKLIEKLNDLITTKAKKANVFLPNLCDKELKSLLLNANFATLFQKAKTILPPFSLDEVNEEKYELINKQASVKGSKISKRDLETDLANFYIYYMAKESTDISRKNVKDVFNAYKRIMFLTKNESLMLACANSLGRVEFKADRVNANLGGQ
jgi:hypothetical protein